MFFKGFNKLRITSIEKMNFLKAKVFEWLSIFNESIIIYRKTQKVNKNDLIEMKK